MLGNRKLVIDTMSEVYQELKQYRDAEFWDFASHDPIPGSIYVLGRQQVVENQEKFRRMAEDDRFVMIFGNSAEGSSTLVAQIRVLKLEELIKQARVLLISGGDIEPGYHHLTHEHFLVRIFDYEENRQQSLRINEVFVKEQKPYKFLFLNGRARPHRKYLWEKLRLSSLLDQSLHTMLDGRMAGSRLFKLMHDGQDLMDTNTPITTLPEVYEVDRYHEYSRAVDKTYPHQYVKAGMFNTEWGEVYLKADAYIDTYFSLVTETIIEYPYSFRTEKIAKPLAMGHPWICASNRGFYRDIRNLGFKTFDTLIDETFDDIDNNQDRMDRILNVVHDLCSQDLVSFLRSAESICKYNQQHLKEIIPRIRKEFPERFVKFINHERP